MNHSGAHVVETREDVTVKCVPAFDDVFENRHVDERNSYLWEKHLVFGQYAISEVLEQVKDANWQRVRISMLSTSRRFKWEALVAYLERCKYNAHSRCVVTNYVYALKRGGVIK